jgi:hypothetical protein
MVPGYDPSPQNASLQASAAADRASRAAVEESRAHFERLALELQGTVADLKRRNVDAQASSAAVEVRRRGTLLTPAHAP